MPAIVREMPDLLPVVDLRIDDESWRDPELEVAAVIRAAAAAALAEAGLRDTPVELSVLLTNDDEIARLNARWRGRPRATNVLSFPAVEGPAPGPRGGFLGDIALAFETLVREAADAGIALADHVSHMMVHGILHLLGHDHGTDREAREMERREARALGALGVADPYGDPAAPARCGPP